MNIIVKPYGSDLCCCRPDTTWERENKDFYSPECVNEIYWTPVVFARVCKAGKCVGVKFVERYYDGVGCGMLMYCGKTMVSNGPLPTSWAPPPTRGWENAISDHMSLHNTEHITTSLKDSAEERVSAEESGLVSVRGLSEVVDKSSILPHPLFLPVVMEDEKEFVVSITPANQSGASAILPSHAVIPNQHSVILSGAKELLEEAICNASQLTSLRIGDLVAVELRELEKLASKEDGTIAIKGEFCEKEIFGFNIIF